MKAQGTVPELMTKKGTDLFSIKVIASGFSRKLTEEIIGEWLKEVR